MSLAGAGLAAGVVVVSAEPAAGAADPGSPLTWSTESLGAPAHQVYGPLVRFGPDGTRFVAQVQDTGRATVTTWPRAAAVPVVVDLGATNAVLEGSSDNHVIDLAVAPNGAAAVVWTDAAGVPHLRTQAPTSTAWSATTDFPSSVDDFPTVAITGTGETVVAWRHRYNGTQTVEAVVGGGRLRGDLRTVATVGDTTYEYLWRLQAGFASGFAQLVWERGGSSADDGTGGTTFFAGYDLYNRTSDGWGYRQTNSYDGYTSSHAQLVTDVDGTAAVVYERDAQVADGRIIAVVPYVFGYPQLDTARQSTFSAPALSGFTSIMTHGTTTVVWSTPSGSFSATVKGQQATKPVPLDLPLDVGAPVRLLEAADGTQTLILGQAMVALRAPGATRWTDPVTPPLSPDQTYNVDAALSRSGTLVVTWIDFADGRSTQRAATTDIVGQGGLFHAVAPTRVLDTRTGLGAPRSPLAPGASITVRPLSAPGVAAAQLNVTVTNATGAGYVQLYPHFATRPTTSSVNFGAGRTVANQVVVRTASDGTVTLYNGSSAGTVDVVADLTGWFQAGASGRGGETVAVTPARVLDTRSGLGGTAARVAPGADVTVGVVGHAGVPASGVAAVLVNVTATETAEAGYLTSHASGTPVPGTSDLNFSAGRDVAAGVVVPVGTDGAIQVHNGGRGRAVDVVVDVTGYVTAGTVALPGSLALVAPTRILDTRQNDGFCGRGPIGRCATIPVTGRTGVPDSGVAAAVFTATATDTSGPGFLAVTTAAAVDPLAASTLNFDTADTVANAAWSPLGTNPMALGIPGSVTTVFGPPGRRGNMLLDLRGYVLG